MSDKKNGRKRTLTERFTEAVEKAHVSTVIVIGKIFEKGAELHFKLTASKEEKAERIKYEREEAERRAFLDKTVTEMSQKQDSPKP